MASAVSSGRSIEAKWPAPSKHRKAVAGTRALTLFAKVKFAVCSLKCIILVKQDYYERKQCLIYRSIRIRTGIKLKDFSESPAQEIELPDSRLKAKSGSEKYIDKIGI